jgi:hypothetical protein
MSLKLASENNEIRSVAAISRNNQNFNVIFDKKLGKRVDMIGAHINVTVQPARWASQARFRDRVQRFVRRRFFHSTIRRLFFC